MVAADIKKGSTFEKDGNIYVVVDFQHHSQPRLAAFIKVRLKNIETGQVLETRMSPTDRLNDVVIEKKEMQYLYNDGGIYYFMDTETYEQLPINKEDCEDALNYITENMTATIKSCKGKIISVEPPLFVDLEIVECEPAVAGDTNKNASKPAKVETGFELRVPLFVNNHERIRIDTRTGEYMERI